MLWAVALLGMLVVVDDGFDEVVVASSAGLAAAALPVVEVEGSLKDVEPGIIEDDEDVDGRVKLENGSMSPCDVALLFMTMSPS